MHVVDRVLCFQFWVAEVDILFKVVAERLKGAEVFQCADNALSVVIVDPLCPEMSMVREHEMFVLFFVRQRP